MPGVYDKMGIHFLYPENWTLDEEDAAGEASVTVYSPGGAFWTISLHERSVDPKRLAETALDSLKAVYEEFEAEPVTETVAGRELTGYDANFYCLDLTNTAQIRAFRNSVASCIILSQAEDRELVTAEPVFRAITTSLVREK